MARAASLQVSAGEIELYPSGIARTGFRILTSLTFGCAHAGNRKAQRNSARKGVNTPMSGARQPGGDGGKARGPAAGTKVATGSSARRDRAAAAMTAAGPATQ